MTNENSGPLTNNEFRRIMDLFTPKKERRPIQEEPANPLQGNPRLLVIQDLIDLTRGFEILVLAWHDPATKAILNDLMNNTDVPYPFAKPIDEVYQDVLIWKNTVIEQLAVRSDQ